jgi:hypothetical protein
MTLTLAHHTYFLFFIMNIHSQWQLFPENIPQRKLDHDDAIKDMMYLRRAAAAAPTIRGTAS